MIIMMQYSCLPRSIKFIQLFSAVVIFFENNKIEPWHEHSFVVIKQDGSDEPHLNKLTKHIMAVMVATCVYCIITMSRSYSTHDHALRKKRV